MSGGVFAVSRGLFEHPLFAAEPYTEREAWIWLIKEAAWKGRRVRVGSSVIDLKRGQCAFSTRFLANKWQWSESKVRRFLNKLKTDAMVLADTDAGVTRLTICNYDEYQIVGAPTDAVIDAQTDAAPTQERRKEETGRKQDERRKEDIGGADAPADFAFVGKIIRLTIADFDRWRKAYPAIPDLVSELAKADAYYSDNPTKDGKWFFPVSSWLKRANDQMSENLRYADKHGNLPGDPWYAVDY
jgi:hypothetical protein